MYIYIEIYVWVHEIATVCQMYNRPLNTGDQDLGKDDHTLFHQVLLPPLAVSKQALGHPQNPCKHRSNLVHCYNRSSQQLSPFATREYIAQGLRMKYWFVWK